MDRKPRRLPVISGVLFEVASLNAYRHVSIPVRGPILYLRPLPEMVAVEESSNSIHVECRSTSAEPPCRGARGHRGRTLPLHGLVLFVATGNHQRPCRTGRRSSSTADLLQLIGRPWPSTHRPRQATFNSARCHGDRLTEQCISDGDRSAACAIVARSGPFAVVRGSLPAILGESAV